MQAVNRATGSFILSKPRFDKVTKLATRWSVDEKSVKSLHSYILIENERYIEFYIDLSNVLLLSAQ